MFQGLSAKLRGIFSTLRGQGVITRDQVDKALRSIRMALLEADVSLSAVKSIMGQIQESAVGEAIIKSVSPEHMVTKFVHDALVGLLDHPESMTPSKNSARGFPIIMMVGLQGNGKTSMSAKIAHSVVGKKLGKTPLEPDQNGDDGAGGDTVSTGLLVSLDPYRPGAQEQLRLLAQKVGCQCLTSIPGETPMETARRALEAAKDLKAGPLILDTAGRMETDALMMEELEAIKALIAPSEIFLVADALLGQSVVETALAFHARLNLTGICLSKIDGDARGGAALSLRHSLPCPIKLMGSGELPHQWMAFDAQRLANAILDRGDIVGLVEKASQMVSMEEAEKAMDFLKGGTFNLTHLAKQLRMMNTMGGLSGLLKYLPGMGAIKESLREAQGSEAVKKYLAIVDSMTLKERITPSLLNAQRKQRIAKGSGTQVCDINQLLKRLEQMQMMMRRMGGIRALAQGDPGAVKKKDKSRKAQKFPKLRRK